MLWSKPSHRKIGDDYEQKAVEYLVTKGLEVLAQNYHCRGGEIDIIAKDDEQLVFIEVKYRKSQAYGLPEEMVFSRKQKKLTIAAKHYLSQHCDNWPDCRFDVIAISGDSPTIQIEWIKNAFYTE